MNAGAKAPAAENNHLQLAAGEVLVLRAPRRARTAFANAWAGLPVPVKLALALAVNCLGWAAIAILLGAVGGGQ